MIQNIKISFNILLVVILSIAISGVLPELPVLEEIVEIEEIEEVEELDSHIESCIYQSYTQLTGAGDDGGTYLPINLSPKRIEFKKEVEIKSSLLLVGEHPLHSVPFFIRYCSLIVYS